MANARRRFRICLLGFERAPLAKVEGLTGSVQPIDAEKATGTGILFRDYNKAGLECAMRRALDLFDN